MKYGEKDDSWRSRGRVKSVEIDALGRVSVELEKYYLKEPTHDGVKEVSAIPGWLGQFNLRFMGSGVSAGDGYGKVSLRYAGMTVPMSAPGDDRSSEEKEKEVSVEVTLERTPLTMHPRINEFLDTYGGTFDGNEIKWVERDPTGESKRTAYNKDGAPVENINPFYGIQQYLEVGVKASVSQPMSVGYGGVSAHQRGSMDGPTQGGGSWAKETLAKVGKVSAPDYLIPAAPKGRNWLCTEAEAVRSGNGNVVRQSWQLSGIGGWEPLIYDPKNAPQAGGEEAEGES